MKSGASDPFGDSEDERSESSEQSSGERSDPRDEDSEDERSESSESRTESEANRERAAGESSEDRSADTRDETQREAEADPAVEGGTESEGEGGPVEDDGPLSRDELPFVLRRDRVKDERPEVHQLFVQQGTHDRAVDAERALEDRLGVDLSRTDAREAIYLAGMAHLDDAEEILRTWGYDL